MMEGPDLRAEPFLETFEIHLLHAPIGQHRPHPDMASPTAGARPTLRAKRLADNQLGQRGTLDRWSPLRASAAPQHGPEHRAQQCSEGRGGDGVRDRTRSRDRVGRAGIDNAEARPKRCAQWARLRTSSFITGFSFSEPARRGERNRVSRNPEPESRAATGHSEPAGASASFAGTRLPPRSWSRPRNSRPRSRSRMRMRMRNFPLSSNPLDPTTNQGCANEEAPTSNTAGSKWQHRRFEMAEPRNGTLSQRRTSAHG